MCGFSGVLFSHNQVKDKFPPGRDGFRKTASRISHRGDTDHKEIFLDNIWLSHFRLAFQDVDAGVQPMISQDKKHIIVFNGELYNHLDLRKTILAKSNFQFETRSDTETILEGWKILGNDFFDLFDGEYAFVILDINGNNIIAHRDLHGVKPLFFRLNDVNSRMFSHLEDQYTFTTNTLEFSSEIKGLASKKQWSRDGLLRQYVGLFEPICTPFQEIIHIPAGGIFEGKKQDHIFQCSLKTLNKPIRNPTSNKPTTTDEFEEIFNQAVKDRMLSDVELGIYLSGGVDSKSIAYELSRIVKSDVKTKSFTLGFTQAGYDETEEALRFARHVNFDPHVLKIDNDALNYSYPLAVQTSELIQPYTNGAAKWWLSLFARQYVQGVFTGDGADEVFCGYPSYRYTNWWKFIMRGRGSARSAEDVLALIDKHPLGTNYRDRLYVEKFSSNNKNPWLSGSSAEGDGTDFVNSIRLLGVAHPLFSQISAITHALLGKDEGDKWLKEQASSIQSIFIAGLDDLKHDICNPRYALLLWQNYFAKCHLPVLITNWVGDRMEMSNTLEGRTPFMARRVYDLMSTQPDHALVHGLRDKKILRQTYAKLFPASFANTPKKQFNAPFLNSNKLMDQFKTNQILENAGIASSNTLPEIQKLIKSNQNSNPYLTAHLQSTYQTAICLSIVNDTIINENEIVRDHSTQQHYLSKGGQVT